MDLKQVIFFAQKNGYETVEKLNNWNGYECYEPIMDSKKETEIGPPLLIKSECPHRRRHFSRWISAN